MREIKFKIWDIKRKEMVEHGFNMLVRVGEDVQDNKFHYLQYTGLKDKNGKEIYEGYIVSMFGGTQLSRVWFSDYGTWTIRNKPSGWSGTTDDLLHNEIENIEVVGNIYENPELLK